MTANSVPEGLPSQDERIMAALAHACSLIPMLGTVGAIVIWATQKEKSRYTAFQALQAVVYHITMIVLWFLMVICYMGAILTVPILTILMALGVESESQLVPFTFFPMAIPFTAMGVMMFIWFLFLLYGLTAAAMTLQGKDFRYIVIGRKLEKYLAAA